MKTELRHILLYSFWILMICSACSDKYIIKGTSSVQDLDGKRLYLKAVDRTTFANIDSSEVVHGVFKFTGSIDTTMLTSLYMDDESIMPVVLEPGGSIVIKIKNSEQRVSGTPLNDKLYDFIDKKTRIDNRLNELPQKQTQMILSGVPPHIIHEKISEEQRKLLNSRDKLETSFVIKNYDNVLGPSVFMIMTCGFQYPVITPQIQKILNKATVKFKSDPYVKEYIKTAQQNMRLLHYMHYGEKGITSEE